MRKKSKRRIILFLLSDIIPSLTLGKIKNGYKPLNEGVKCHFLLCKSL